jgi:hypothetical protein
MAARTEPTPESLNVVTTVGPSRAFACIDGRSAFGGAPLDADADPSDEPTNTTIAPANQ